MKRQRQRSARAARRPGPVFLWFGLPEFAAFEADGIARLAAHSRCRARRWTRPAGTGQSLAEALVLLAASIATMGEALAATRGAPHRFMYRPRGASGRVGAC